MAVDTAFVVDLDMDVLVVEDCRLVGLGPVLDTVSCEDSQNKMCLVFHAMDSLLDEFVRMLVLPTPG